MYFNTIKYRWNVQNMVQFLYSAKARQELVSLEIKI